MEDPPEKRGPRKNSEAPHCELVVPATASTSTTQTLTTAEFPVNGDNAAHIQLVACIVFGNPNYLGSPEGHRGAYFKAPPSETPAMRLAASKILRARERALREAEYEIQSEGWRAENHHYLLLIMMDP